MYQCILGSTLRKLWLAIMQYSTVCNFMNVSCGFECCVVPKTKTCTVWNLYDAILLVSVWMNCSVLWNARDLLKQCAAVSSHFLWMSVAPHWWSLWYCILPIQGHSPLRAITPPTILWDPTAGRTPQSERGVKVYLKCVYMIPWVFWSHLDEKLVGGIRCKLTTISLICLVGAVQGSVTLWVDLADADAGTTPEVPTAVKGWETGWKNSMGVSLGCKGNQSNLRYLSNVCIRIFPTIKLSYCTVLISTVIDYWFVNGID